MSYATARARVVAIVEGVTPTSTTLFARPFRELAEGATVESPPPRSFWLESSLDGPMAIVGPYTPDIAGQPRVSAEMTLTIAYRDFPGERDKLDQQLVSDWIDVSKALGTPSNYQSTTSGLLSLTAAPPFFSVRRVYPRPLVVEQRVSFPMLFR